MRTTFGPAGRSATAIAGALFAAGCASPAAGTLGAATSIPFGDLDRTELRAMAGQVVERAGDAAAVARRWPAPPRCGAPADAVLDPMLGTGAIAFANSLAFVDITAPALTWCEPPRFAIRRLAVRGDLLLACGEYELALFAAAGGRWVPQWRSEGPSPLASMALAMPLARERYVAAGVGPDGLPHLVRMSREQGSWQVMNDDRIAALTRLDGAVHLVDTLLLFGVFEEAPHPAPGGHLEPMRLELRCVKYDVATWSNYRVIVAPDTGIHDVRITSLALGVEHVVFVTNRRDVSVYELSDTAARFRLVQGPTHYDGDVDAQWLGGDVFRIGGRVQGFGADAAENGDGPL